MCGTAGSNTWRNTCFQNTSEDENPPACPPEGVAADVLAAGGERLLAVNGEVVTGHEAGTEMLKSA